MTSLTARRLLAMFASVLVPLGGCTTPSIGSGEEVGEDTSVLRSGAPPVDPSAVRELRILVQSEDGTLEDLGERRWPVRTLTMIRDLPMSQLVVNEKGYAIAFSPAGPPLEGVEDAPEAVPMKEVAFSLDGRLMWWVPDDDIGSCPDQEESDLTTTDGADSESADEGQFFAGEETIVRASGVRAFFEILVGLRAIDGESSDSP